MPGHAHGQPPGRVHRAGEHLGHRLGAALAGQEGVDDRRGVVGRRAERVGPAGQHHHDDRGACRQHRVKELGLHAGQAQVVGVAALPRGAPAEHAGPVTDGDHAHVAVRGQRHGGGEAVPVVRR